MLKRIFKIAGLVVLVGSLSWLAWNQDDLRHFPSIISSYYAKELCSCLYVVGRPEADCHEYVRQYIPISGYEIDNKERRVTVHGLGRTNSASYVSDLYGCNLDGPD